MSHSWPIVPLGEVLRHRKEFIQIDDLQSYKRCRVQLHAQGIVLRDLVPGVEIKTKKQQVCRPGDFLVAEIDAKVGGFGLVPADLDGAIVSSHYFLYEFDERRIDRSFLGYFIRTPGFRDQVSAQGSTNYAAIRPQDVLAYTIPLPPLNEQRRLVTRIDELDEKIRHAKKLKDEAEIQRQSFHGSYVVCLFGSGRNGGGQNRTLGDYATDFTYGTSEKTNDDPSGLPVLRMGNIQAGRLVLHDLKYLQVFGSDRNRLLVQPGDILVNRTNSAELVGKCAVFDQDGEFGFASYLIRVRLETAKANPTLVAAYINSPIGREYMLGNKKQMTGQANVNTQTLKSLPLPLPPIEDQGLIVERLREMESRLKVASRLQTEGDKEMDALLPAILNRAFQGTL